MKTVLAALLFLTLPSKNFAQVLTKYQKEIIAFQKKYVAEHELVKGDDRKYFQFFAANEKYKIVCNFKKATDTAVLSMATTSVPPSVQYFTRYGTLHFKIGDTMHTLTVYQPKPIMPAPYADYLFIPFLDNTSAIQSYGSGRYIDMRIKDFATKTVVLDFNKAYNPYCAYAKGFNCPVPPKENFLNASVLAGERNFGRVGK
jgi:uncharacterized protein